MNVTFMGHVIRSVRTLQDPIHVPVLLVMPVSLKEDVSQMKVTNSMGLIHLQRYTQCRHDDLHDSHSDHHS